uniref:HDC08400 n=1 Tax=Drosophila melanogaster TaxID=7227 RepID=Q6ILT5_DROME|nr:TPA_inf: HDC08400 [Drosophila melanogaster]
MLVIVCGSQGYALKPGLPLRCSEERTKTSVFVKRYALLSRRHELIAAFCLCSDLQRTGGGDRVEKLGSWSRGLEAEKLACC